MINENWQSANNSLIQIYSDWAKEVSSKIGWDLYLFTIMFNGLPGSEAAKILQMHQDIMSMYSKLATRVVRKPRSEKGRPLLPIGIFVPDLPVVKKCKSGHEDAPANDGLHMHGIVACHRYGRLRDFLDDHFAKQIKMYQLGNIRTIHVKRIDDHHAYTAEYGFKGLKLSRFSSDHVLIVPKAVSELPDRNPPVRAENRKIKDIQAAWNLSDEAAGGMVNLPAAGSGVDILALRICSRLELSIRPSSRSGVEADDADGRNEAVAD